MTRFNAPSIENVKLPSKINHLAAKYEGVDYAKQLTAKDREILNSVDLYPFSF